MAQLTTSSSLTAPPPRAPDLPPTAREALAPAPDLAAAERFTRRLTRQHYENFSVVSLLLPRRLRQDFCNVYAFCRTADDLADEVPDPAGALQLLDAFRNQTQACYAGESPANVFAALSQTIRRHDIPIDPFLDLIDAFEQDQRIRRYETFEQVVDYCRRSADPVGRLVLYMCGYRDAQRQQLSDLTCTALQLANFWQDVRRDIVDRDRIYIPRDSMRRFGVTEDQIRQGNCDDNFRQLMRFEVDRTEAMFVAGRKLLPMLDPPVRRQVGLFAAGGQAVLEAIRRQNFDTLAHRPALSKWQKGKLIAASMCGGGGGGDAEMEASHQYCARLTRAQAANFYFGLKLLPEPKRSAMFALYAYMRSVDDIADAEDGRDRAQRTADLEHWRLATHAALAGRLPDSPGRQIWPAFADIVHRYAIPHHLFDDVIAGQRQDLESLDFATFEELHLYCYRVAGAVGLASIHIWGFEGGEPTRRLAIDRGLAFQLTNIIRDLREDAARGRIYFPREDFTAMKLSRDDLLGPQTGKALDDFLTFQIERAKKYYRSSEALEEKVHPEARPTLLAMTRIYRGLLDKIAADPRQVLRRRVSLSTARKLAIAWRATRAG